MLINGREVLIPLKIKRTRTSIIERLGIARRWLRIEVRETVMCVIQALPARGVLNSFHRRALRSRDYRRHAGLIVVGRAKVARRLQYLARRLLRLDTLARRLFLRTVLINREEGTVKVELNGRLATANVVRLIRRISSDQHVCFRLLRHGPQGKRDRFGHASKVLRRFGRNIRYQSVETFNCVVSANFVNVVVMMVVVNACVGRAMAFRVGSLVCFGVGASDSRFCLLFYCLP